MKEQNKQILQRLYAFDRNEVLKAFELYKNPEKLEKELTDQGWYPVFEKPENCEFYNFDGFFWVQTKEAKQAYIKGVLSPGKNMKQKAFRCPECGSRQFVPVVNTEGLKIYGCKSCRFSKLIG